MCVGTVVFHVVSGYNRRDNPEVLSNAQSSCVKGPKIPFHLPPPRLHAIYVNGSSDVAGFFVGSAPKINPLSMYTILQSPKLRTQFREFRSLTSHSRDVASKTGYENCALYGNHVHKKYTYVRLCKQRTIDRFLSC